MHTELDADPNVFTIRIVPAVWHVFDSIAETHAQVFVVHMLNVMLSIMFQYALAKEIIKVIHSLAADQSHNYLKHHETCVNLVHAVAIVFAE